MEKLHNEVMIFCDFFSKVKQAVVNSSKHGINELLHELTNDLKLRILGSYRKWENIKKIAKVHRILVL